MSRRSYLVPDVKLAERRNGVASDQVRGLQRDLRSLGYLRRGIDGLFGPGTTLAVKALQHDLMANDGMGKDGSAPVKVKNYNKGRVSSVTGEVDFGLAQCLSEMLEDPDFPTLPKAEDPAIQNRDVVSILERMSPPGVPMPFLLAILMQESGLKHFHEPQGGDEDTYIIVGLDRNNADENIVTSRGYGAGQHTLFHHPPRREEISAFMLDPKRNVMNAANSLHDKFDNYILGRNTSAQADDRVAEIGNRPLRICKYSASDSRYLSDCALCLKDAGFVNIQSGVTTLHANTTETYQPTQYHSARSYQGVPIRSRIGCDWPYAVRRYNGAGVNSYHYQSKVLLNMTKLS